ncbi:MAG: chemotaxis protein methyltransferase CheR [Frankiaceae bacterium]|jgi:chemotaxis protein methyltransferase CheR|nr:chemotaxis protein methyltransferase CheR [Frankiaceae bacterium]MDQ1714867.1 chemotaxis protein methyltransferase CheR [Frankiaceae bacterium]
MTVGAADFDWIAQLVWQRSAIVLEKGKEYLVESRLAPLARKTGAETVSEFVTRLIAKPDSSLISEVIDAMTTNETSWFRDHYPFQALQSHVLPELTRNRGRQRTLRVWSAGCSSGQEPYSIAMVVQDHFALHPGWAVDIIGSDLSDVMLEKARNARYGQLEVNRGLPVAMLVRHFERLGTEWQLRPEIRRMVDFRSINLAQRIPEMGTFDIIFLRNVLIYFDADTKRGIFEQVKRVLRPDGYLFLGGAETTLNVDPDFEPVMYDRATCYRLRGREVS